MGAKYLPTTKDLKASERFRRLQEQQQRLKKAAAAHPPKPVGKK